MCISAMKRNPGLNPITTIAATSIEFRVVFSGQIAVYPLSNFIEAHWFDLLIIVLHASDAPHAILILFKRYD